jgi:hypothetical protein
VGRRLDHASASSASSPWNRITFVSSSSCWQMAVGLTALSRFDWLDWLDGLNRQLVRCSCHTVAADCDRREIPSDLVGIPRFERVSKMGGAGHWPAPVGDPPTGTGAAVPTNRPSSLAGDALLVPSGESPDGTGQWPVLPSQPPNTLFEITTTFFGRVASPDHA